MLSKLEYRFGQVLRAVPIFCLSALFVLLFINVVARSFSLASFPWFDEVVQGLFAWMVFAGAAALWRDKDHFQVDWLSVALNPVGRRLLLILIALLSICFLMAMTWYGLSLTRSARAMTPILQLPTSLFYAAIPISGAIMLAYSLAELVCLVLPQKPQQELTT
ncbi:TRAP transporter small permease [Pseudooceanicola algae]|uniref:TRAP transporter small permease protein n=1 Tax=Pseudooceanicola algae TaxID=1537215 RepID=A0A418SCW1_9RHOB|nr:TRAP transporter small permease [Pseudooceanicola algae]QPM92381.1 hypothetical protein PSAL_036450 [Pseudooceanicola algae]